jgi:K(+)-stimulated pyrophosphate-energized sodium pump
MGADLYESYYGSILATAALGVAAAMTLPNANEMQVGLQMLSLPMALAGVGVFLSIVGIFLVHTKEGASVRQLMGSLMRGVIGSSVLILIAAIFLCRHLLSDIQGLHWWGVWLSICAGMIAGIVIGKSTEYFTSYDHKPTRHIADTAETGAGTVLIAGLAVGMRSTWVALLTVIVAILCAYGFAGGMGNAAVGLYGVGLAAVSMLSTLAITLATDAYGPIADNAGGNAEMTGQDPSVREKTDALDALGNTTAAMGKGFAIGSAALTALALLAAYVEQVRIEMLRGNTEMILSDGRAVNVQTAQLADFVDFYDVNLMNPRVLCGLFAGAGLVFLFSSLTMSAVGRAAMAMVREVRRQFRDIPGILDGTGEPDYERCVEISTIGAQKEMIVPSLLALIVPIAVGLVLNVAGVMGLLAGGLVCGFAMAIFMANAGGAWDNAKKYIETGAHGGKGSDAHKAAIVGDTVGDPFKDTSGPSLNILIKLMSMVSIVFAGLVVKYSPYIQSWLGLD